MISSLYIQSKFVLRDKIIIISILLPIFLGIFIRVYTPDMMTVGNQIAVIKDDLSDETIKKLREIAIVTEFSDLNEVKERVLVTKDEIIGVVLEHSAGDYKYVLEGNETTRALKDLDVIDNYLRGNNTVNKLSTEILPNSDNEMKYFLMTLTMIIALYMGSTLIAFNIIEENECGINNINKILPVSTKQYIIYKIIVGLIGTILITSVTGVILIGKAYFQYLFLFSLISACCSSCLGLYLGLFSKDLISGIIYIKVILLVFIFVPVIGFIMPNEFTVFKKLFYLIPTYSMFEGFWSIIKFGDVTSMIKNMAIVLAHTVIGYVAYYYISKSLE
ncbi:ABC transporter permease [Oceanirhabdus seepicola]|uniref:ABC transporter permease n=1 Tax=Oceanirhabdus seepicola TaxID=2828781 RepID=A0A9J6P0F8_9CLOT|nr:ABC transporter permease [Oceanirhabdus seepicola]MCM1989365.1 ABC transporter permease [Oceanirhabdus seepicola]